MSTLTHSSVLYEIEQEARRSDEKYGDFASAHEALGVLLEEFEEFKTAVMLRQDDASRPERLRQEAIQIAAIALRFAEQAYRVRR